MNEKRRFRDALGKFATGVTVVTTIADGNEFGMTANAFMSVSLNPKLVVVSIGNKAKMKKLIDESGKFAVNILTSDQKEISMHFAGQKTFEQRFQFEYLSELPIIRGALAQLACKVVNTHEEGDHTLYIGEVIGMQLNHGDPLLFFSGDYRGMADVSE